MPWTIAHAAAVLPLRKLCPRRLSMAGLVLGSFSPDFGNYINQDDLTRYAHTLSPDLLLSVLLGFLLLVLLRLFYRPFVYLLPQPHRSALLALSPPLYPFSGKTIAIALFSLLIGAITHLLWDSFTHSDGFFASRLDLLQPMLINIAGHELHGYSILQHLSSILGTLLLVDAYTRYLRKQTKTRKLIRSGDLLRYVFFFASLLFAFACAVPMAFGEAKIAGWSLHSYSLAKCVIVYFTNAFVVVMVCAALVLSVHPEGPRMTTRRA